MKKHNPNAAIEKRRVDLALKIIRLEHKIPESEVRRLKDEYASLFSSNAQNPKKRVWTKFKKHAFSNISPRERKPEFDIRARQK